MKSIYCFKHGAKFETWELDFFRDINRLTVLISRKKNHQGKPICAVLEYILLNPRSPLLLDLNRQEYLSLKANSFVAGQLVDMPTDEELSAANALPDVLPLFHKAFTDHFGNVEDVTATDIPQQDTSKGPDAPMHVDNGYDLQFLDDVEELQKEEIACTSHLITKALLSKNKPLVSKSPQLDA